MGKRSQLRAAEAPQRGLAALWGGSSRPASAEAQQPAAADAPVTWGAPVPLAAPAPQQSYRAAPPVPAPPPPPPPAPAPPLLPMAAPASVPRRRPRSSLPRADAWCDDDCTGSQQPDGEEQPLVGWARDTPGAKRPMPSLQTRAGGGGAASARPSALSTLLGLGPHASFGGARTTPARSAPPPAPAAWEQWIAAAAGPVSDGTTPGAAQRGVYSDAAATPGRMDVDGARGRATALTPASLAAAVAAAAAAAGASTLAPQHRGTRSAGAVPRTTGGAGSRRQQQRARLLALLEQIDAGTASEQTPAPAEAAPPAAFAAPPALDDFPVDPRDLAALLEAAAAVPQPQQQQPAAPCAPVGVERADRQPLAALQANGPAGGVAAPLFPAAPAPLLCGIAVAADDDEWGSDFWEVPAPAAGAALRVLSAVDEARSDGGGPARRVRLRDDAAGVEYALELRDDWADTPLAPGDAVCVDAPWSFCGDATLRAAGPGRLVLHPEVLVSATAVAASLSCLRRAVLAERMGPGAPSAASLYGSATHALLQNALTAPPEALAAGQLPSRCDAAAVTIAAGAAASLQAVGQSEAELRKHLSSAAPHAAAWVAALRGGGPPVMASRPRGEPDAALELHRVADVEEMVWAPRAGLKGQLDATVEARLGAGQAARRAPLELKTGRFRAAAEHGAQVALYTVLLAERHGRDGPDAPFGLLHYSVADTRGAPPATVVVAPDSRELASLMGARNALAAGIVAASRPGGALPPIAAARSECARCFRAADCATAAAALEGDDGSAAGVADVFQRHVAHVSPAAAAFLRHWDAICGAEVALLQQRAAAPWLPAHEVRRRGGTCLEGLYLVGGAAALSAPRPAPPEDEAVAQGRADISDGASCDMEYDFLLCATDPASLAAAAAAAAAQDDGPDASGAVPATLGDAGADAAPAVAAAAGALPPAALALLGRFGAGDRVLLSLAPPAGAPAADVTVLARACVARVAPPPASGPGVPATAVALLTLRCRRAIAVPARCGDAGSMAWRADRDDGAGLVTRMRATVWALVQQPPPCRLRELVAELAPPGLQAPAPPRPEEASAVAAAASLEAALNAEQRGAVDAVLCAHDFSLLRGLPGTGKTATLCAAVAALVARGASVLLACHTHSALDNALARLQAAGVPGLLRLGDPARAAPAVRALCLGGAAWPDAAGGGDAARVVGATCHACGSHPLLARRRFHVAVLDEAAQVPLPLALAPLCRADAFVLVGDPAQLPPLWAAPAARAGGGEESLFARLATAHPSSVASLTVQYRMAEDVQAVANALVYGGALRCGNEATAQRRYVLPMAPPQSAPAWVRAALCPSVRVALLDTDALGPAAAEATRPLRNTGEAALAAAIAAAAVAAGAPVGSLALMTPYNAQVEALQAACAAAGLPAGTVETTTVDRAQGRDLPAVVLSCVRTAVAAPGGDEQQPAVNLLDDARRLCVALTRAQGKMLILASVKALRAQPLTAQLVDFCAQRSWLVTLPPDALQ